MNNYLKTVGKTFLSFCITSFWTIIIIVYLLLTSYLIGMSTWMAIPMFIIALLVCCYERSKHEDKSMENFITYMMAGIIVTLMICGIALFILITLGIIIKLLTISFWFAIPIFVVGLLLYSYKEYRKATNKPTN